jgi:hypothetical protein
MVLQEGGTNDNQAENPSGIQSGKEESTPALTF